jgi:excisionase family DNA binding protein
MVSDVVQEYGSTYLTTAQAARLLMVSPGSVRVWIGNGLLDAQVTPGGHRRILRADLERFARERGMALAAAGPTDRFRILIVEDDEQFAEYLRKLLTRLSESIEVYVATSGFEAGFLARDMRPNVILLDLMMPTLDGFQVCERIKRDPQTRSIRIIAMTGYYSEENVNRILALGASECLSKPFEVEDLLRAIGLQGSGKGSSRSASIPHPD